MKWTNLQNTIIIQLIGHQLHLVVVPLVVFRNVEQVLIDAFNTYIQIGIGSLLFLFGLTFNCLSLLYFRVSRSFRHTTFQLYFSIISILDTVRLLEFLVFILFDKGYLKVTLALCRSIFFTIMFTGQVSRYSFACIFLSS